MASGELGEQPPRISFIILVSMLFNCHSSSLTLDQSKLGRLSLKSFLQQVLLGTAKGFLWYGYLNNNFLAKSPDAPLDNAPLPPAPPPSIMGRFYNKS